MAKFCVKEYVNGYYYYEVEITENIIDNLNQSLAEKIVGFIPLTIDEVIAIENNNADCKRYFETYKSQDGTTTQYLNSMIHEWLMDTAWLYEKDSDVDTVDVISYIKQ